MIAKEEVIGACETLRKFCYLKGHCKDCPLNIHCGVWISSLMEKFIEVLENDRPTP